MSMFYSGISLGVDHSSSRFTNQKASESRENRPTGVTSLTADWVGLYMADWLIYGVLAGIVLLFFFLYLMARRTVLGFKEGMDSGRDGKS